MTSDSIDEEDLEELSQQERAMKISNIANILLLAFKVINHFSFRVQSSLTEIVF